MDQAVGAKDAMINLKDVIEVEKAEVLNADPKTFVKVWPSVSLSSLFHSLARSSPLTCHTVVVPLRAVHPDR